MKSILFTLMTALLLLWVTASAQENNGGQNRDEKKLAAREQTELLLNSRNFDFTARMAIPQGGRSISLANDPNYVRFRPDHIESYMPYFGRTYGSSTYGGDAGLKFEGKPEAFTVTQGKKNFTVKAEVKGSTDAYKLILTVGPEGNATLAVNCNNRGPISYQGVISAPADPGQNK